METNIYLVPYDFTDVGDAAINYANFIGKRVRTNVIILNIVPTKDKIAQAQKKLHEALEKFEVNPNVNLIPIVRVGSIFESIAKTAIEDEAQLIIMGTHGNVGMQKFLGSHAMKVITSTNIPFLIVQKNTVPKQVQNIIVPIDMTRESLQIVNLAGDIARIYDAEVHVVAEKQNDEIFLQKMKNRILIVKNQFEERNIKSQLYLLESGGSYSKKVLQYCKENDGDFIAIAYHNEALLPQFNTYAQNLIMNDMKLPCLIINSKEAANSYF